MSEQSLFDLADADDRARLHAAGWSERLGWWYSPEGEGPWSLGEALRRLEEMGS